MFSYPVKDSRMIRTRDLWIGYFPYVARTEVKHPVFVCALRRLVHVAMTHLEKKNYFIIDFKDNKGIYFTTSLR